MCGTTVPSDDVVARAVDELGKDGRCVGRPTTAAGVDVLLVVDSDSTMCPIQTALAERIDGLVHGIRKWARADVRIGVVSTEMAEGQAALRSRPGSTMHRDCRRRITRRCTQDAHCTADDGEVKALPGLELPERWICSWRGRGQSTVTNQNGSVNSACILGCASDATCADHFADPTTCVEIEDSVGDAGCMKPGFGGDCPDHTSLWLDMQSLDEIDPNLRCQVAVGLDDSAEADLGQGLNAAWLALSETGPNQSQRDSFLRPDAWLLILVVSDGDDCSLKSDCILTEDGTSVKRSSDWDDCISPVDYGRCPILAESRDDGPLVVPETMVERLKRLKGDPSKVLFAVLVGDSRATSDATRESERLAWFESEAAGRPESHFGYVCSGPAWVADHGRRYSRVARLFGDQGLSVNLCGPPLCTLSGGGEGVLAADGSACIAPAEAGVHTPSDLMGWGLDQVVNLVAPRLAPECF